LAVVVLLAAGSGSCPSCAAHPGIKKGRVHGKAVLYTVYHYVVIALLESLGFGKIGRLLAGFSCKHSMAGYLPLFTRSIIFCFAMFVHHGNSPRLIHIYRVYLGCVHLFNFPQEKRPHSLVPAAKLEGIYGSNSKAWRYHSGSGDLGSPSCFLHVSNGMFF